MHSRKADIFKIEQGDSELLRNFGTRFNRERTLLLMVPDTDLIKYLNLENGCLPETEEKFDEIQGY